MAQELKFTLVLDGKQYTGALQAAEEATDRFTDAATNGSRRASEALRDMGGAAESAATGGRRAKEALQGMAGQADQTAVSAAKAGDALRRMTQVQKLDAARDILNIRSFADIQREIQQVTAAYNRLANSGKLSSQELEVANQAHAASVERLKAEMAGISSTFGKAGQAGAISAGQTAAAWRQLPMQLQDVGVSLAGGMSPLLVLAQQGPQITSAFGGVRETLVALRGAITPLMLGAAGAAAAIGSLGIAYMQGAAESRAFEQALVMTGGRIGLTSNQLGDMSARLGQMAGITQGQAAQALASLATQTGITSAGIERIAAAALRMEAVGGPAAGETAKAFSELAKSPLSASIKLNEQTGFLTESVYKQIRALESQGKTTEAAKVAQEAYASALEERIPKLEANLGSLERGWKAIKDGARAAWDAMLDIGREGSLEDKLAAAQKKVLDQRAFVSKGGRKGIFGESLDGGLEQAQRDLSQLESEAAAISAQIEAKQASAAAAAKAAAKVGGQIANDGVEGDRIRAIAAANLAADLAQTRAAADAKIRAQQNAADALAGIREAGLISERDFLTRSAAIDRAQLEQKRLIADAAIKAEQGRPLKADDAAGAAQKRATLAALNSDLADIKNQISQNPAALKIKLGALDLTDARASAQEWAQSMQQTQAQVQQFADQSARAAAQLITDPMARARAEADVSAKAIERSAQQTGLALDVLISKLRAEGQAGMAAALQAQRDASAAGAAAAADAARKAPDLKLVQDYIGADVGVQIADGFDKASQSLSVFVKSFQGLFKVQEDYNAARAAAGSDTEKLAAIDRKHTAQQLTAYATMAGAAKGMFKEHTAGYKAVSAAEQAFRLAEMAGAMKTAAVKMGLISAETAAKLSGYADSAIAAVKTAGTEIMAVMGIGQANAVAGVAGQAQGDPYSAFPRMAAMAAIMAGLGFAVSGGIGGDSSFSKQKANSGTGTVLGDRNAQSASIVGGLEALKDVDLQALSYSAQMAASLRNIEDGIRGVGGLLARSGRVAGAADGVQTGYSGGGGVVSKLFGSKTTVIGTGITGAAQSLGEILASGTLQAAYYADIEKKKKFFGITTSTKVTTQMQEADGELERQFGSILASFAGSVRAAAGPLGIATAAVEDQLKSFVVDIGKIELQGLTGEQVSEKLTAVFGAVGDKLAAAALGGFEQFQQVGEGYLETVVRVASATESAGETLRRLGIRAVALTSIDNKQGDVGAEIVRQSITRAERAAFGAVNGIADIISTLSGTASDIATTYSTLVTVRETLAGVGQSVGAVTSDLIRGAGGLDALKSGAAAFEDKFLTQSEKAALATGRMSDQFARLGLTLPTTADQFKALVQGVDATTAGGQALLGGLLSLSSGFSEFLSTTAAAAGMVSKDAAAIADERAGLEERLLQAQGNTAELRARELSKLDSSNRALQMRVWALEDETKAAEALANAGKGVAAFIDELRGGGSASSLAKRRATYQADLTAAQAGDAEASGRVVADAKALLESVKATASDPLSLARESARIAAQLQALPATAAYAAQQAAQTIAAGGKVSAPSPVAGASAPTSVPVSVPSQSGPVPAPTDTGLERMMASLLAEVAALRADQAAQAAAIARNTGRAATTLENITPDGDAIATRTAR